MRYGDPVGVARTGATLFAGVDDSERKLYLPFGSDLRAGDVLTFRSKVRRIIAEPVQWRNPFTGWEAGMVAEFEEGPAYLPDLGSLFRPGDPTFDPESGDHVPTESLLWSGACLAQTAQAAGSDAEIGEQQVGLQPFLVSVPLTVLDVRPGDLFRVTSSRDGRLQLRTLVVQKTEAGSNATLRIFRAIDNQGGA